MRPVPWKVANLITVECVVLLPASNIPERTQKRWLIIRDANLTMDEVWSSLDLTLVCNHSWYGVPAAKTPS
jgi:hypothetical protein